MNGNILEDWESPVRPKMRSAGTTFVAESVQVRPNLASEQKNRENRTKAAIKHLLESEAERNEELAEDNLIIEKQIKALIGLLVEKDEKIKLLQGQKPEKRFFFKFGAEDFVSALDKIQKRHSFKRFSQFFVNLEKLDVRILKLKILGNKLIKCFSRGFNEVNKYFRLLNMNYGVLDRIGKKRIRNYFNYFRKGRIFEAGKLENVTKAVLGLAQILVRKSELKVIFEQWKKISKTKLQRYYCTMLQSVFRDRLRKMFFRLKKRTLEKLSLDLKEAHKNYLNNFKQKSQQHISLYALNNIVKCKRASDILFFFSVWKQHIQINTNIKLVPLHQALIQPLRKVFKAFINLSKKDNLCKSLKNILTPYIKSYFTQTILILKKLKLDHLRSAIEESCQSSLSLKDLNNSLVSELSELETENSSMKSKISVLLKEVQEVENSLETTEKHYSVLYQQTNFHLQQLDSYTSQTATLTSKYAEELNNLQIKAKKQQLYIETANNKLQQLIKKHELSHAENSTIITKNQTLQQSLKKMNDNYKKVLEEIKPISDSKTDLSNLSQTLGLQEEELGSLKFKLKNESNELKNLKAQSNSKSSELEQQKLKATRLEEYLQKTIQDINRLESDLQNEAENKDFRLQELNTQIDSMKFQINKSRDEIENLRIQIKETSAKVKYPAKLPDELQVASKALETNKNKLSALRDTVSSNTSVFSAAQREMFELKKLIQTKKEEFDKKRIENSLLENKIALAEIGVQESQKQSRFRQKSKEELENYIKTLEQQVSKLNEAIYKQNSQESMIVNNENLALAQKVEKLERELEFFNEEAAQRRMEVAQVKPEIENYQIILAAMEEKIAENESKLRETEMERDKLRAEGKILKDRFLSLSSHNSSLHYN